MNVKQETGFHSIQCLHEFEDENEWFQWQAELHQDMGAMLDYYIAFTLILKEDLEPCTLTWKLEDKEIIYKVSPDSRFVVDPNLKKKQKYIFPCCAGSSNQLIYAPTMKKANHKYTESLLAIHMFGTLYAEYLENKPERNRFSALEIL